MNFFGIGIPELMLILVIALIVVGPQRLPEVGRSIGKAVRDFREMSSGFTSEWEELSKEFEDTASEVRREVKEVEAEIGDVEGEFEKMAKAE
jgi:sec-independent protein translocase protein TatA